MVSFQVLNIKEFMTFLLKGNIFDDFELRQLTIHTFTQYQITGLLDKEYFTLDEQETMERKYCIWSEIKPFAFQVVKGKKLPSFIKIIFSLEEKKKKEFFPNASALFLNITFKNNIILCITGYSSIQFTMEKTEEYNWDNWMIDFFKQQNIAITTQIEVSP